MADRGQSESKNINGLSENLHTASARLTYALLIKALLSPISFLYPSIIPGALSKEVVRRSVTFLIISNLSLIYLKALLPASIDILTPPFQFTIEITLMIPISPVVLT